MSCALSYAHSPGIQPDIFVSLETCRISENLRYSLADFSNVNTERLNYGKEHSHVPRGLLKWQGQDSYLFVVLLGRDTSEYVEWTIKTLKFVVNFDVTSNCRRWRCIVGNVGRFWQEKRMCGIYKKGIISLVVLLWFWLYSLQWDWQSYISATLNGWSTLLRLGNYFNLL